MKILAYMLGALAGWAVAREMSRAPLWLEVVVGVAVLVTAAAVGARGSEREAERAARSRYGSRDP